MSSRFPRSAGLTSNGDFHILQLRSSPTQATPTQDEAEISENGDTSLWLRFNSLTLDELSEELDKRTKETHRLQNEVDIATKLTLARFGCTYSIHKTPGQHRLNDYDLPMDPTVQQAVAQTLVCCLNSSNQETDEQTKQHAMDSDATVNLQTDLHQVQTDKDIVSDLRMEDLIVSLGQEMALLTDKLSSSKNSSVSLSVKLELLNKLAERQTLLHQCRVSELVSTLSRHKDTISCLEQQLLQAQSQMVDAQSEKEKASQQAAELHSQLDQIKRCDREQQCKLQEDLKSLRGRLEVAEEQLCRGMEEKSSLQILLEQRTQEGRKFKELLEEKCQEVQLKHQEAQQHFIRMEEAERQYKALRGDGETLRLKLDDRKKVINILRSQMEKSTQITGQHTLTIDNLHQENSLLSNQLNQQKMENRQLRAQLDQHKSDLVVVAHEKQRLQAFVDEQAQLVKEESLEKQQVAAQLEIQRIELLNLKNEYKQLQQLHSWKEEEQEGVVLQLQSQLRNVHDEMDQVKRTLKTLEGAADGHGLRAAIDMQERITARRAQIDSLQGKIQQLEEAMDKLLQEKRYRSLENQRQLQELAFVKEEKRQLVDELEALHSKDKQLRDRISQLETILHKMSESFADCQDFIQLREQEFFCMKLRHALDLKELQGPNMNPVLNGALPHLSSVSPSAPVHPPCFQSNIDTQITPKRQQESPTQQLKSLVKGLEAVISENAQRAHGDNNATLSSFHRRRSAPGNVYGSKVRADKDEEVKSVSRFRRKTCNSELLFPKTSELKGKIINTPLSEGPGAVLAGRSTSSTQLLSLGRKSPVYSLLTSQK